MQPIDQTQAERRVPPIAAAARRAMRIAADIAFTLVLGLATSIGALLAIASIHA